MPARLEVDNFNIINIKTKTLLDVASVVGATSITPQNTDGFTTNDIVFIGNYGKDEVEKEEITVVDETLTVDALEFAHDRFEPITDVNGDQVQFYVAPDPGTGYAPPDTAFNTLGDPVSIDPATLTTMYVDTGGGSGFWYKYVYWNSISDTAVTYLADVNAVRGGDIGLYIDVDSVRLEAGFKDNVNVTDSYIASFIVKANDHINTKLGGLYAIPFAQPIPDTIQNIAKLYATGLLLQAQYGTMAQGSQADGNAKIEQADELITQVQTFVSEIYDQAGNSLRIFQPVAGWPDTTTQQTPGFDEDGNPQFGGQGLDSSPIMPITKVY